jgi:hypothetical protein
MGVLTFGAALATVADAAPKDLTIFPACDAYGAPNKSGDGMTDNALVLGIFTPDPGYGDLKQRKIRFGADGIAACNRALEDPLLIPQHWLRRVSLLRARAVHRIATDDIPGALVDLDQATAAARDPANVYYARSLGLGIDLVRAYALNRSGDVVAARSLVLRAQALRPYDRRTALAALIAIGLDAPDDDRGVLLKAVARLDPERTSILFDEAFDAGKFDEAIALHALLIPDRPPINNSVAQQDQAIQVLRTRMEDERFAAWRSGQLAYALAATNQPASARATLTAARERLADVAASPAASPATGAADLAAPYRAIAIQKLTEQVGPWIDYWADQVETRILIHEKRFDETEKRFSRSPPQSGGEGLDILGAIDAGLPAEDREAHIQLKVAYQKMQAMMRERRKQPSLETFYIALPEAEARGRFGSGWSKDAGALKPSEDKFLDSDRVPGSFAATFWMQEASISIAEEGALLTAADLVRAKGGKFFRILRAQDISHSSVGMMYGQQVSNMEMGYATRLLVLPLDASASANGDWRALDADEIHLRLEPLYGRTVGDKKR